MSYIIVAIVFAVLGFIAGLLVGKKNPSVATTAQTTIQSAENLAKKA
jgi:hypothetical protein